MNNIFKTLFFSLIAIAVVFSSQVKAGHAVGKVTHLMVHTGDLVFFNIGTHNDKPACSTAGEDWAVSLKTEMGKAMYSMLLAARLSDKKITATGTNTCPDWGDRESVLFMTIED